MKKVITIIGAIVAVTILGLGIYHSNASQTNQILSQEEIKDLVAVQYPGEVTKMELVEDHTTAFYDVAIRGDKAEYELKLNATSGEVLKLKETKMLATKENTSETDQEQDKEKEQDQADNEKQTEKDKQDQQDQQEKLKQEQQEQQEKEEKAKEEQEQKDTEDKELATSIEKKDHQSKQTNEKKYHKNKEYHHNGKQKYNHKQHYKNKNKYKQERKSEKEKKKKAVISREEAVQIALSKFSGEVDDVDLEEENGRLIYEIEIEREDLEAEIEIDAYTGKVLIMEIDD